MTINLITLAEFEAKTTITVVRDYEPATDEAARDGELGRFDDDKAVRIFTADGAGGYAEERLYL